MNKPWPEVVPFVTCLLNNQTTAHLNGYSPQFILMGLNPVLNQRFQRANRPIENLMDIENKWKKHNDFFQEQYKEISERLNKMYQARGGIEHDFKEGDLVYMRDVRPDRPKEAPFFFRCPLLVRRSLDAVIITEDLDGSGIIRLIHGKNAKKASPFSVEQYQLIPEQVRIQLGFSFTPEELKDILKREGLTKMPRLFSMKLRERFPWTTKRVIDPDIDLPRRDEASRRAETTLEDPQVSFDPLSQAMFADEDPNMRDLSEAVLDFQASAQQATVDEPSEVPIEPVESVTAETELPDIVPEERHVTFQV